MNPATQLRPVGLARAHRVLTPLLPRPLRAVARPIYRWLARRRALRILVDGQSVRFLWGTEPAIISGRCAAFELQRFIEAVRPGNVVADVGAHAGTYTLLAAARVGPTGQVVAFEPDAAARWQLRANLSLNRFEDRVQVSAAAASDAEGTTTFFARPGETVGSLVPPQRSDDPSAPHQPVSVDTLALDPFFAKLGRDPDVVKIDVEGAEFAVLRGAERIVRSNACLFFEIHPYAWSTAGHSAEDLVQWLAARGRRMIELETREPVTEFRYRVTELVKA